MYAGDLSASIACPIVCPQLSVLRSPASFSSAATTSALPRTDVGTLAVPPLPAPLDPPIMF